MSKDLTICVPAYNEEDSIGRTLQELRSLSPESEILVVDDGSSDATRQIAASVQGVRVLSHERNRGYGAALKTGMRSASRKAILWYDADGQHRVEDVKRLIEPVLEGRRMSSLVCGNTRFANTETAFPASWP